MTSNESPTNRVPAVSPAPFDPRVAVIAERTPPPRPPSTWLEPVCEPAMPPVGGVAGSAARADVDAADADDTDPVVLLDYGAADEVAEEQPPEPQAWSRALDPCTGASPALGGRRPGVPRRTRRLAPAGEARQPAYTAEQRLLILDTWQRSGLPAGDYAPLVGVSKHTLYQWKARFEADGPAGLAERKRGRSPGSRLGEPVKRAILLMKTQNPEWGVERIAALLERGPGFAASPGAVGRVLKEAGHELVEVPTRPHRDRVRRFERAVPNQLWQSDLFTFVLKRQNQRVYLVAFLDDHSRFVVSYGLHASQSAALVIEVLRAGIASYGAPEEVLTDNGSQYVTWRGTSAFAHECQKRGIRQIVASPRHPQTLGKTERFWGTLWRECVETAVFADLAEARVRIGHFIDHYNFQRPHSGIDHLVPADRFFGAAPTMLKTLKERVAANALDLARQGAPKAPFYLAGNVGGEAVSVHAAGDRLLLTAGSRPAVEVALGTAPVAPPRVEDAAAPPVAAQGVPDSPWTGASALPQPGTSAIDLFSDPALPEGGVS